MRGDKMEEKYNVIFENLKTAYFHTPVLKTWTPSDYDIKYNSPKKLEKLKIKMNEKCNYEYKEEMRDYNNVCKQIDVIKSVIPELSSFFIITLDKAIKSLLEYKKYYEGKMKEYKDKYDINIAFTYTAGDRQLDATVNPYSKRSEFISHYWKQYPRSKTGDLAFPEKEYYPQLRRQFDIIADTDEKKREYLKESIDHNENYYKYCNLPTPTIVFIQYIDKFYNIIKDIEKVLGGPADSVAWTKFGIGDKFNGIVSRTVNSEGTIRSASFKSFLAGGWNIQKLHMRYRVTPLKV